VTLPRKRRKPRNNFEAALKSLGDEFGIEFAISNLFGSGVQLSARVVLTPYASPPIDVPAVTTAVTQGAKKPAKRPRQSKPPTP
jgi:hypothetical protein